MKNDNDPITSFRGPYWFLSNFYPVVIRFEGVDYPTLEHAYQAAKTLNPSERSVIARALTPGQAKAIGRKVTMRPGWEEGLRLEVMERLERQKYDPAYHADLTVKLVETWPRDLIEGNTWGDKFWGAVQDKSKNGWPWVGENRLGGILMKIRAEWVDTGETTS
jgi:ribA/ribD-fused uncharacterized protein